MQLDGFFYLAEELGALLKDTVLPFVAARR